MATEKRLIELIGQVQYLGGLELALADHLISHGVTITPAVPGPSVEDPNIMELCFHNGERHMKEKMLAKLAELLEGLDYHKAVFICKCLEDL